MLPDPPRDLNAHYQEFRSTGSDPIDAILESIAMTVTACRHAGEWELGRQHGPNGYWDLIQRRANEAAVILGSNGGSSA